MNTENMNNKIKNKIKDAGNKKLTIDIANSDESCSKERIELCKKIEECCDYGNRARCYELINVYSYNEPFIKFPNDAEKANYHIIAKELNKVHDYISEEYTLNQLKNIIGAITKLYDNGFFNFDGICTLNVTDNKIEASAIAKKAFSILNGMSIW